MKFVANLIVAASMFVGQFSTPYAPQASAQAPASEVQSSSTTSTTENNKPRETATPTPTGTSTPSTETSTPVPPSTEVPPVETTVPEEPVIAVNLTANPDFVTPGGQVNINWQIDGISIAGRELFLNIILPKGFTPNGKDLKFDEASLTLSIPVLKENGQFQLQAGEITEDAIMMASLVEKETSLAKSSLVLATKDQFSIKSTGGEVQSSDGLIQLSFPTDTFTDDAIIQIGKPTGDEIPAYSLSGHPFSIKAQDTASKSSLHQFDKEVEIKVSYADMEISKSQESKLAVFWYNPETETWEPLLTSRDVENKVLIATTPHFSVFDYGIDEFQSSRVPTIDSFQVSEYTGSATYSLPIQIPSGPGGFQPNIGLNYNSQVVDQSTTAVQASWVGMGWSLDTGSIERNTQGTNLDEDDDTFFLNVAGVSTRLVKDASGNYHAADENFWRINYVNGSWKIWDKQGNIYYFETTFNTSYAQECNTDQFGNPVEEGGIGSIPTQWALTRATNVFNQEITYTYVKDYKSFYYSHYTYGQHKCIGQYGTVEASMYPSQITYAGGHYRVRFQLEDLTNYQQEHIDQLHRLAQIFVESDQNLDGNFDLIRRYDLTYETDNSKVIFPGYTYPTGRKVSTLAKIQEFGVGGAASDFINVNTFTYGDSLHLTKAENGYGGYVEFDYDTDPENTLYQPWYYTEDGPRSSTTVYDFGTVNDPCRFGDPTPWQAAGGGQVGCEDNSGDIDRLTVVGIAKNADNNTFMYAHPGGVYKLSATFNKPAGATVKLGLKSGNDYIWTETGVSSGAPVFITLPANAGKALPLIEFTGSSSPTIVSKYIYQFVPTFYRVYRKTIYSGHGGAYEFNYSYTGAAVNDEEHSNTCAHEYPPKDRNTPPETTCQAFVETYTEFRGNETVTVTGPDGSQTVTTYHQSDELKGQVASVYHKRNGVPNPINMQSALYEYEVTSLPWVQPGGYDFLGFSHVWVKTLSTTSNTYDNSGNIVATTKTVNAYENSYGNLISQAEQHLSNNIWSTYRTTYTYYKTKDTNNRYLVSLPARQYVTKSDGAEIAETWWLYDGNTMYDSQLYEGKLTGQRTLIKCTNNNCASTSDRYFSDTQYVNDTYGNRTTVNVFRGNGAWSTFPGAGSQAISTTTVYDSSYHAYPTSITNALGQTTTLTYDYLLGVPLTESDANDSPSNDTTITALYDAFGRVTDLARPGNSIASPTLHIAYTDSSSGLEVELTQKINDTQSYTLSHYYNGLGREYQTDANGTLTDFTYDGYGHVSSQSTPHTSSETPYYTLTTYDELGRPKTITAPDQTGATYTYNGLTTTVTDARGNVTTSTTDIWGRTVSVTPPTGPSVTYTYNELGQMLTVMRGGLTTTLTYDQAGRKTAMTDPDMGYWTYQYDALDSLTQQVDAKGQFTCMYYDSLNRLKGKNYLTSACPADPNTYTMTNSYDAGTNGIGRRTGMTNNSNGLTTTSSWTYDTRGRIASETVMGYATYYSYNSADLLYQMTYPGGEVVTNTYNNQMLLTSLSGTLGANTTNYVQSSVYDSASRLTDRTLGNGETQKFIYSPWDSQGGRVDKIIAGLGAWNANTQTFATTHQKLDYAYDPVGNITQIFNPNISETQTFTYDALDRLTRAQASGVTSGAYNEAYAYSTPTGNMLAKADVSTSPAALDQLVSWWSMDETSGTRFDSFGSNHLTDNNTVTYAAGKKGNAANFVTANLEYLSLADNPSTSGGDVDFTLAGHVYLNSTSSIMIIANKGLKNSNNRDYTLFFDPSTSKFTFKVGNGSTSGSVAAASTATSGQWYAVIAWHDSVANTLNIQVNNGAVSSSSYSLGGIDTSYPLSIGAHSDGTSGLNGRIDEFALYKRVLTSNERSWFYNNGSGRSYADVSYTYDPNHRHAVKTTPNGNSYTYDANGNMITRHIASGAEAGDYTLAYDAENRLTQVNKNGVLLSRFYYDGDGRRVKSVTGSEAVLFVGAHFEASTIGGTTTNTKYYFAGTTRVAVRKYIVPQNNVTLTYLLSDHLGSTSLTMDSVTNEVIETRYKAWGEVRYTTPSKTLPTRNTFTGQYSYVADDATDLGGSGFGLMFYNARWYDPSLGRFTQADTIIPESQGVQAWDRYAFVNNNPVRYTDSTGHVADEGKNDHLQENKTEENSQEDNPSNCAENQDGLICQIYIPEEALGAIDDLIDGAIWSARIGYASTGVLVGAAFGAGVPGAIIGGALFSIAGAYDVSILESMRTEIHDSVKNGVPLVIASDNKTVGFIVDGGDGRGPLVNTPMAFFTLDLLVTLTTGKPLVH